MQEIYVHEVVDLELLNERLGQNESKVNLPLNVNVGQSNVKWYLSNDNDECNALITNKCNACGLAIFYATQCT